MRHSAKRRKYGDCYQAAAGLAIDMMRTSGESVSVCHGIIAPAMGPMCNVEHGHAWVEVGDTVYDHSNGKNTVMPRAVYYALAGLRQIHRYPVNELIKMLLHTKHYGTWTDEECRAASVPIRLETNKEIGDYYTDYCRRLQCLLSANSFPNQVTDQPSTQLYIA